MDFMEKIQELKEFGKSPEEKQQFINVSDVFYVWDILVTKFDIMETMDIIKNFINDKDLGFIASKLVKGLLIGIQDMERVMDDYGIPHPYRPPAGVKIDATNELITDRYIYDTLQEGIHSFFFTLSSGFMNSTSPIVRKAFKEHMLLTMDLHELIVDYGKLKGYIVQPPVYRA